VPDSRSESVGTPTNGKLLFAARLPKNPGYVLRNPDRAWGTRETVNDIVEAFTALRKVNGVVPSIMCMFGFNAGGGSYLPRQGSFMIQPEGTFFGLTGPGVVKSAHDCSEGGLAVALAESCISQQLARETPRLIGAQVELRKAAHGLGRGQSFKRDTLSVHSRSVAVDFVIFAHITWTEDDAPGLEDQLDSRLIFQVFPGDVSEGSQSRIGRIIVG